ncbi:MAG: glutamine amidotransferase [Methanomicrobiales archaeon]|nr:glutamine amidotransferase [Methanomicrobiales archaeon]
MIVLVDLSYREGSLAREEFVLPIAAILNAEGSEYRIVHHTRSPEDAARECDGIILCGTPVMDNGFLETPQSFSWIAETDLPVLGICAGMEILALLAGGRVVSGPEIGMTEVRVTAGDPVVPAIRSFEAYELHENACTLPPGFVTLAESDRCIQMFRDPVRPVYGVMFHPEVRNEWVVGRFVSAFCRPSR